MQADQAEAKITANDEQPETYAPTASLLNGHHTGPRTLSAAWYPDSEVLKITFNPTSPASGGGRICITRSIVLPGKPSRQPHRQGDS